MTARRVLVVGDTDSVPCQVVQEDESLEAVSVTVTEALTAERRPACAVFGRLPDHDVVNVLAELREQGVPAVVCADLDPERMNSALATGLAGYVPPDAPDAADLLHDAVTAVVADGQRYENLERYLDRMTDAFLALDAEFRFVYLNARAATLIDVDPEAVIGESLWDEFPAAVDTAFQRQYERAMETGDAVTFEEYFPPLDTWFSVTAYPSETGLSVYFRDVSERIEREHELERRIAQQEAVSALGRYAVESVSVEDLLAEATERVGDVLDSDAGTVAVFERHPDGAITLRARDGSADAETLADGTGKTAGADASLGGNATVGLGLSADRPVAIDDFLADDRVGEPGPVAPNAASAAVARIGPAEEPWGSVVAYDGETGAFDASDATFLESVGGLLATAIGRIEQEREIEQQRDRLALLAKFDAVVQETIGHAAEAESREEIERFACERLAGTDGIEFAWISDGETGRTVTPSEGASETAGYVDEITITSGDRDTADGPTGRAVATGEIQVSNDIANDPDYESWREAALERNFRSSAAVPLTYRDHQYGVLNIYANHTGAFPAEVQQALSQLGQNLAHAMNALNRRDALITDAQTELEFHARDSDLFVVRAAAETGATITLDGLVERSAGSYIAYLSVEDADVAAVAAVAPVGSVSDATVVRQNGDGGGLLSVAVSDPDIANALATRGAELVSLTATPDGATIIARLPRSVDTRTVVEAVTDALGDMDFRAKRTFEPQEGTNDEQASVEFDLTDRQREALESALHAGYFDWPRRSTGEAVAESMGITAPTFQEHLRSAQQKLLEEVFDIRTDE